MACVPALAAKACGVFAGRCGIGLHAQHQPEQTDDAEAGDAIKQRPPGNECSEPCADRHADLERQGDDGKEPAMPQTGDEAR